MEKVDSRRKFAVSYRRASTKDQAERFGAAQRAIVKEKACKMGIIIDKEFLDVRFSAYSTDRPALKQMLGYIKENKDHIGYVFVKNTARLTKDRDENETTKTLDETGVLIVSDTEHFTPLDIFEGVVEGNMGAISKYLYSIPNKEAAKTKD